MLNENVQEHKVLAEKMAPLHAVFNLTSEAPIQKGRSMQIEKIGAHGQ
jgi:hypothetical protein